MRLSTSRGLVIRSGVFSSVPLREFKSAPGSRRNHSWIPVSRCRTSTSPGRNLGFRPDEVHPYSNSRPISILNWQRNLYYLGAAQFAPIQRGDEPPPELISTASCAGDYCESGMLQ